MGGLPPPVLPSRTFSARRDAPEIPRNRAVQPQTSGLPKRPPTPFSLSSGPNSPDLWTAAIWYGFSNPLIAQPFTTWWVPPAGDRSRLFGSLPHRERSLRFCLIPCIDRQAFRSAAPEGTGEDRRQSANAWSSLAAEISDLRREHERLASASDVLMQLNQRLSEVTRVLTDIDRRLEATKDKRSRTDQRRSDTEALRHQALALLSETPIDEALRQRLDCIRA